MDSIPRPNRYITEHSYPAVQTDLPKGYLTDWVTYRLLIQPAARAFKVVNQVTLTDVVSAVKTIPFDGKTENYIEWSSTFIEYFTFKECSYMILEDQPDLKPD